MFVSSLEVVKRLDRQKEHIVTFASTLREVGVSHDHEPRSLLYVTRAVSTAIRSGGPVKTEVVALRRDICLSPGKSVVREAASHDRESQQARTQQHEAGRYQREEPIGD